MDYIVRPSRIEDEGQLRSLWTEVFGDGDEYLNPFFDAFYSPGAALVCDFDGRIISSVYPLDIGRLILENGAESPCRMIYALGTLPEYRGRGCARALMTALSGDCGYILRPAEEELFNFYSGLGYSPAFYAKITTLIKSDILSKSDAVLSETDAADYARARKLVLQNTPHIEYNVKCLRFQELLCKKNGGGMFSVNGADYSALCVIEKYLTTLYVKELLVSPEHYNDAVSAIAQRFSAGKLEIRSPAFAPEEGVPFGMLKYSSAVHLSGWYGLAFD